MERHQEVIKMIFNSLQHGVNLSLKLKKKKEEKIKQKQINSEREFGHYGTNSFQRSHPSITDLFNKITMSINSY